MKLHERSRAIKMSLSVIDIARTKTLYIKQGSKSVLNPKEQNVLINQKRRG